LNIVSTVAQLTRENACARISSPLTGEREGEE